MNYIQYCEESTNEINAALEQMINVDPFACEALTQTIAYTRINHSDWFIANQAHGKKLACVISKEQLTGVLTAKNLIKQTKETIGYIEAIHAADIGEDIHTAIITNANDENADAAATLALAMVKTISLTNVTAQTLQHFDGNITKEILELAKFIENNEMTNKQAIGLDVNESENYEQILLAAEETQLTWLPDTKKGQQKQA